MLRRRSGYEEVEEVEEVEAVVAMLEVVSWMLQARPAARREMAVHEDVMNCQKVLLVHSPCRLMSIWSKPCW